MSRRGIALKTEGVGVWYASPHHHACVRTRVQRSPHGHPNAHHHMHPVHTAHGQHATSTTYCRHHGVVSCSSSISPVSPRT